MPRMTLRSPRLVLAAVLLSPVGASAQVRLELEAPAHLAGTARTLGEMAPGRLETVQRLSGLEEPGPPIRVILAPEGSAPTRGVPGWVAGYAVGARGVVVLMPARALSYPDSTLDELLLHEVAHVLISRAADHRRLPRWFDEGLAVVAGTSWGFEDRSRLTLALVRRGEVSLDDLDRLFTGGASRVPRAYAISGAVVRELLHRHGSDAGARILDGVAAGLPFRDAFREATGSSLEAFEESFWRRYTFWYRWLPILTSSATLWFAVLMLAVLAARRRRLRAAELEQRWEEEDRLRESRGGEPRGRTVQ